MQFAQGKPPMLHLPNPDLMKSISPHYANGLTKDPHAHHRQMALQILQAERHARWLQRWLALRRRWRSVTQRRQQRTI
ncbi:MAG: hypothetical protein ABI832_04610 [bacterium]